MVLNVGIKAFWYKFFFKAYVIHQYKCFKIYILLRRRSKAKLEEMRHMPQER